METRTMRRLSSRTRWVGAAVLAAEIVARAAWAAPMPVRVEVKADALDPTHAKTVGPTVRDAAAGFLLDDHGLVIEADATTTVVIELRPIVGPKERDKVIFRVTVLADGEEVYAGQPTSCWGCDETKLLASMRTQVAGAVEHLPEPVAPAMPAEPSQPTDERPGAEAATGSEEQGSAETVSGDGASPPPLVLRNVGIGLTTGGAAFAGVGIGLAVARERVVESSEERERVRTFWPTGTALATIGGAALVGGVVALVVYGTRKKRANPTTWVPAGGPGFVGFAIERRF